MSLTPVEVAAELFAIHSHAEIVYEQDPNRIVYAERDLLPLLEKWGIPAPDFEGYAKEVEQKPANSNEAAETVRFAILHGILTQWQFKDREGFANILKHSVYKTLFEEKAFRSAVRELLEQLQDKT